MIRKRLVVVLTINNGVLFRTRNFIPDYRYTLNFVDAWSVDEIIALDITRPGEGERENFYAVVEELATKCFVPLTAGGGVRTLDDFRQLLKIGADKVVINTGAVNSPAFITEAARMFGSQCVVVSIDAMRDESGKYEAYAEFGRKPVGLHPAVWAQRAQELGAGEIMITSIDRDGMLEGYDNELNFSIAQNVTIPVLACGGAGKWQDFVEGFSQGRVSAVCTTNIYHFTETSIKSAKKYLAKNGVFVRI